MNLRTVYRLIKTKSIAVRRQSGDKKQDRVDDDEGTRTCSTIDAREGAT